MTRPLRVTLYTAGALGVLATAWLLIVGAAVTAQLIWWWLT